MTLWTICRSAASGTSTAVPWVGEALGVHVTGHRVVRRQHAHGVVAGDRVGHDVDQIDERDGDRGADVVGDEVQRVGRQRDCLGSPRLQRGGGLGEDPSLAVPVPGALARFDVTEVEPSGSSPARSPSHQPCRGRPR